MDRQVIKNQVLREIKRNTTYIKCTFYLDYADGELLEGTVFENCSFRGWFCDWGRDTYGLWMAITCKDIRQVMRWIKPGTFTMGSPLTETHRLGNENQRKVTLDKGFWLAETTCTQELWKAVMEDNPSSFQGEKLPVETVNVHDCQAFMEKWNKEIPEGELSFPTQAQWEYACRAGTTTAFSFGNSITRDQVNYEGKKTVTVKSLPCNNWGLYEMHGNVSEWCSDLFVPYDSQANTTVYETFHIIRGGSWNLSSSNARSAYRYWHESDYRLDFIGFRFCLRNNKQSASQE